VGEPEDSSIEELLQIDDPEPPSEDLGTLPDAEHEAEPEQKPEQLDSSMLDHPRGYMAKVLT
jgi:hypothetical protein